MRKSDGFDPIGEFSSEFEAEALVATLRSLEFHALVDTRGGLAGQMSTWVVSVASGEKRAALDALISLQGRQVVSVPLARCPHCGYSLDGLAEVLKCPECGGDLELERLMVRSGVGARPVDPSTYRKARGWLIAGVAVCAVVGAVNFLLPWGGWFSFTTTWAPPVAGFAVLVAALVVRRKAQQARRQRRLESAGE